MSENISISGQVKDFNEKPIFMIKVTVYRDDREIDHVFTNEAGDYEVSIPQGTPITVRFDTHHSLTNAKDWHPSVVANLETKQEIGLNRFLLRAGTDFNMTAFVEALAAYEFCAMWEAENPEYAESVPQRLNMMKLPPVLLEIHQKLLDFFIELSGRPAQS